MKPLHRAAAWTAAACFCLLGLLSACSAPDSQVGSVKFLIGVSQANMSEPWRISMYNEIRAAAAKYPNVRILFTDAADSPRKQISDVNTLLYYGVNLLIVSPSNATALTPVVERAYQRIPVIILDRAVEGYNYTLHIGPDNEAIGRKAGTWISQQLGPAGGKVLMINGTPGSPPRIDRDAGFRAAIAANPRIEIIETLTADWLRDRAEEQVAARLAAHPRIDMIFAQNDPMALGARLAVDGARREGIRIVGVDGLPGPQGGIELLAEGKLDASFTCPTGGREAVDYAMDILNQRTGIPKKIILRSQTLTKTEIQQGALQRPVPVKWVGTAEKRRIRLGFTQVGAESSWRVANTASIRQAAASAGIELDFVDGQQSQEVQIAAIRGFIRKKVDVIAFSPIVENGWEAVLYEAKQAGIPVILTDRRINVRDDSFWVTFMGSDFIEEGRRAARWLLADLPARASVKVVELQGTEGSSPAIDRKIGFQQVIDSDSRFQLIDSAIADFTREQGRIAMQHFLEKYGRGIDVLFAHNDDMALGAIEAIRAFGLKPGSDIRIVSIDAVRPAFQAMVEGSLNCTVECTPLLGPQLMKAVQDYMDGKELPIRIITAESVFPAATARQEIGHRQY